MDWKRMRETGHSWGGFKISKSELNMSQTAWKKPKISGSGLKMSRSG